MPLFPKILEPCSLDAVAETKRNIRLKYKYRTQNDV